MAERLLGARDIVIIGAPERSGALVRPGAWARGRRVVKYVRVG